MSEITSQQGGNSGETRGRKKLPEGKKRSQVIAVKVNEAELAMIDQLAAHRGIKRAEWIRRRALGEL